MAIFANDCIRNDDNKHILALFGTPEGCLKDTNIKSCVAQAPLKLRQHIKFEPHLP
jgi:hypothetical protein